MATYETAKSLEEDYQLSTKYLLHPCPPFLSPALPACLPPSIPPSLPPCLPHSKGTGAGHFKREIPASVT